MVFAKYLFLYGLLIFLPVVTSLLVIRPAEKQALQAASTEQDPQPNNGAKSLHEKYTELKDSLADERNKLAGLYKNAETEAQKNQLLEKARHLFLQTLQQRIIPAWYGTPWEFYGASEIPNEGSIACGYFVTTVLRDAGVKLDRVHLAEIESETMIRTVIGTPYITRYKNKDIDAFINSIKKAGDAFYIVGLDYHTGFLLCDKGKTYFIHAYIPSVIKADAYRSYFLRISAYRVTGKISHDPVFVRKWLLGESFPNLTVKK